MKNFSVELHTYLAQNVEKLNEVIRKVFMLHDENKMSQERSETMVLAHFTDLQIIRATASLLSFKSHANFSCSRLLPRALQGREF